MAEHGLTSICPYCGRMNYATVAVDPKPYEPDGYVCPECPGLYEGLDPIIKQQRMELGKHKPPVHVLYNKMIERLKKNNT